MFEHETREITVQTLKTDANTIVTIPCQLFIDYFRIGTNYVNNKSDVLCQSRHDVIMHTITTATIRHLNNKTFT